MRYLSAAPSVVLAIYLAFHCTSLLAASWSVGAYVTSGDSTICKFDMSIDMYMSSVSAFTDLDDLCRYHVVIIGPLALDDIDVLRNITAFLMTNPRLKRPSDFVLDSPGGSIAAAISIAREIRTTGSPLYGIGATVFANRKCYSSCVLIVAASFQRHIYGELGIHRPRFIGDEYLMMGYDSLQAAYSGVYSDLKRFFAASNIHPSLIDDMWMVPSSELQILSEAQMKRYGLNTDDIVMVEQGLLEMIATCGEQAPQINKSFDRQVMNECADSTGFVDNICFQRLYERHPWKECHEQLYGW